MVRIGRIEYANCTPIFHALQELFPVGDYRFVGGVPAQLNRLLAAAEIDVCPSSSIEFALRPDRYLIIPDLSISSSGPVASVLLFSNRPLEELDGKLVLLSAESATSVNLLKILLQLRYGCRCTFAVTGGTVEAALREAPALLLIGDTALRAGSAGAAPHVYDLGGLWYEWTGQPFVFALWLASRAAAQREPEALAELARRLGMARRHALQHLERIADRASGLEWMGREQLLSYWRNNISYELGREHLSGLQHFFHLASELGLIAAPPELVFLPAAQ